MQALLPLLIERFVQEASEAFSMIQNKGLGGDPRFYGGWLQDGITLLVGLATTVKEAANLCAAHTECSHAGVQDSLQMQGVGGSGMLKSCAAVCFD